MKITSLNRNRSASYLRNFVFGVEDSLVATVGLLSGIAVAGVAGRTIFLTGIIFTFVEAFSMAVGSFLSESSAAEYAHEVATRTTRPVIDGIVMFVSYFVSGFIPLFPYIVFDPSRAFSISIVLSLAALFVLGVVGARLSGVSTIKSGARMFLVGGAAIAIGVLVGRLVTI